jgi:hypothetical protein
VHGALAGGLFFGTNTAQKSRPKALPLPFRIPFCDGLPKIAGKVQGLLIGIPQGIPTIASPQGPTIALDAFFSPLIQIFLDKVYNIWSTAISRIWLHRMPPFCQAIFWPVCA